MDHEAVLFINIPDQNLNERILGETTLVIAHLEQASLPSISQTIKKNLKK